MSKINNIIKRILDDKVKNLNTDFEYVSTEISYLIAYIYIVTGLPFVDIIPQVVDFYIKKLGINYVNSTEMYLSKYMKLINILNPITKIEKGTTASYINNNNNILICAHINQFDEHEILYLNGNIRDELYGLFNEALVKTFVWKQLKKYTHFNFKPNMTFVNLSANAKYISKQNNSITTNISLK